MKRATVILALPLLAVAMIGSGLRARAQEAPGRAGPADQQPAKPVTRPAWQALSAALPGSVPRMELPAPDVAALLAEDRAHDADKSLRTGVGRELTVRMKDGHWDALADRGWVWRVDVVSNGAKAIRLHFDAMQLPDGGELVVWPDRDPTLLAGPFRGRGPLGDGQCWTVPLPGERVRVEFFVPGKEAAPPEGEAFLVDQLVHVYRDPFADPGGITPEEGSCHNDVTCFPGWADLSHAVARVDFVSGGNSYNCSGQLMNSQNGDLTPYFLTANHCISSNAAANSAVLYWLFQTSSCNGTPPSLGSAPQSSYCTLLSTNTASDYTLLMVEGTIPSGQVYWTGWTTSHPSAGAAVTCIHHPDAAYKRISFGTFATNPNCNGPLANHVRSNWFSGVTEPGSSGGGLFRDDSHLLIGQVHCGPSFCGAPGADLNDSFGDFAVTYPNVAALLAGGSDDGLEEDDACAGARAIGAGTYNGLVVKNYDEDWYSVFVPASQRITVTLNFTHAWGDIDCELYGSCGGAALVISNGTGDSETLDYENLGAGQNFLVHVHLYAPDTRNQYNMTIAVNPLPNLNATVTPAGFASPAVPRNAAGAGLFNCPLTPTLDGNVANTYINWAIQNEGPGTTPQGWESRL